VVPLDLSALGEVLPASADAIETWRVSSRRRISSKAVRALLWIWTQPGRRAGSGRWNGQGFGLAETITRRFELGLKVFQAQMFRPVMVAMALNGRSIFLVHFVN
jgi:hypothetical protein